MKNNWLGFIGRILLSFIMLIILYTIHFIIVKKLFEENLTGLYLDSTKLISSFFWSFLGGVVTYKIAKEHKRNSIIIIAFMAFAFMLLNYPNSSNDIFFHWVLTFQMVIGVLLGGFLFLRRKTKS